MQTTGTLWRDTARPVKFLIFDARVVCGLSIWAFHMRTSTFIFSVLVMLLFVVFDKYGVTPPAAWRLFKQGFFNPHRTASGGYNLRRSARW